MHAPPAAAIEEEEAGRLPETGAQPTQRRRRRTSDVFAREAVRFDDLMLSEPLLRGVQRCGFEHPSPVQLQAIPLGKFGTDLIVQVGGSRAAA